MSVVIGKQTEGMYATETRMGPRDGHETRGMMMGGAAPSMGHRHASDRWLQHTQARSAPGSSLVSRVLTDRCYDHLRYHPLNLPAHRLPSAMAFYNNNPNSNNPIAIAPLPPHQQHQLFQQSQSQPPLHQSAHMARKRPKYSRSKLGCLSCRVRKVKCDETRPICTRCAHSQRECTWPAEMPKSKKGGGSQANSNSDSAPTSRPTSSGAPNQSGATSDSDWQSDSGPAAGPIRNLSSAHGRASSTHSRNSSINSIRGRELGLTLNGVSRNASANHSRSRDRSPNPFAFNVSQLGPPPGVAGHHQRSTSNSSNISNPTLPYPLLPQQHPPSISTMGVPGLSNSQTSSPSTAPFIQSPTMVWPPVASDNIYGSRPGTSSASIVAGLGNIDLNNLTASTFNVGLDGNGYPAGGDFGFNAAFDGSNGFSNAQNFDPVTYGAMDTTMNNSFEQSFNPSQDLDPTSFLVQLQQSLGSDGANYTPSMTDPSLSGSTSSGSPEMDVDNMVGSLDSRALSGAMAYNHGHPDSGFEGSSGNQAMFGSAPSSSTLMTGFREAQIPMAASGFGLTQSMPDQNQLQATQYGTGQQQNQTTGFGGSSSITGFGSSPGQPAHLPPRQPDSLQPGEYGATTSTSSPMGMLYPTPSMTTPSTMHMAGSLRDLSSSPTLTTMTSSPAYGSTSGGTPQLLHLSDKSAIGARPPMTVRSPEGYLSSVGGEAGAEPFTGEVRAGAQEDISSRTLMERTMRMTSGPAGQEAQSGTGSGLYQSANLPMAGSRSAEDERGQLHSDTPRPSFHQQQQAATQQQHPILDMDLQFDSPSASPPMDEPLFSQSLPPNQSQYLPQVSSQFRQSQQSQHSQQALNHARSRSDTITPQNAMEYALSPTRGNSLDDTGSGFSFPNGGYDQEVGARFRRQWGSLSPSTRHMIGNPDPLEPFFKSVQERNLIRHYCQTSTRLMMALPSSLNPILSIHLPIILSLPATAPATPPASLVSPPTSPDVSDGQYRYGSDDDAQPTLADQRNAMLSPQSSYSLQASVEALRLSLLGVAAIHQSYLLTKSGPENRQRATEMWELASHLRVSASRCLGEAVATIEGCRSDAALGACVSIALVDIFAGGYNYSQNMELAKTLVEVRGGPGAIVRHSAASVEGDAISPSFEGPAHFVEAGGLSPPSPNGGHKKRRGVLISSARLLLEILTIYEVFSTLTSGEQPTLLRPGDSAWWFEGDKSNYHLFSVENMFGVSRSIIELFARVNAFLNRHSRPPQHNAHLTIQGHPTPNPSRPSTPTPSLSGLSESPPPIGSPLAPLHAEACTLLREVESWNDAMLPIAAMHPRIRYGNYAHKSALLILLLREAFNLPPSDVRVQKCAEMTLLAALKASADFVMSVDLTWPVIIAGCQCSGGLRLLTMRALEGFRKQCCFEIDTSELIVNEVWRRMDAGESKADFRGVVEDLNLQVLIL